MPERKPPTKIFSKKELKRSRIDRKYRKGFSFETVEDLGTHFEKRRAVFPKDLEIESVNIPKERSKYYQPIYLGNAFNIISYQDSGNIFSYRTKDRSYIGKMEDHDLMKLAFDILKYYGAIKINHSSGRLSISHTVGDFIRRNYRKELIRDFVKNPVFKMSKKKRVGAKGVGNSRKTATYKYIYNKLRSLIQ